ncbi:LytTR family transcriptional regulator [Hyphomonadaceae bacterium ML37]|nr:LytTR family transcriptional regulator [Hyphomonadaceae bacterium ML37]
MISRDRLVKAVREAGVLSAIGTFLAVLGPYGTQVFGWPLVWVYWTGLILLGGISGDLGVRLVRRLRPHGPDGIWFAGAAVFLTVPVTAMVFTIDAVRRGAPVWSHLPLLGVFVLVIAAAMTGISYVRHRQTRMIAAGAQAADADAGAAAPACASAALIDKLPVRLRRAAILSMSAEDHYLRVRTDAGETLILMRLSDAAAACAALDGARTHRSWWVARAAVADARKGDGRGVLILTDGTEVPVSRSYYPALKEAGWF